jgi:hypothetical protein
MDDDKAKGIIDKTIEAVEEFAREVSDVAKHMIDPPEPLKPGDEVIMLPMADGGMFAPPMTPQYVVVHHPRKSRAKKVATKASKTAAKTTAKKSAKKTAKKASPKKAKKAKKAKATAVKKKTGKKVVKKKKAKKAKR